MRLFIKIQNGRTFAVEVEPDQKILEVQQEIQKQTGIPITSQVLVSFSGKPIASSLLIQETGLQKESTLLVCEIPKKQPMDLLGLDECKKCRFQVEDPRVLACGHSFCLSCLPDPLSCTICQTPNLRDSEIDWIALSCLEASTRKSSNQQIKPSCSDCPEGEEKKITKWCKKCNAGLCDGCDEAIHQRRIFHNHVRIQANQIPISGPVCDEHGMEKEFYCCLEEEFLCCKCIYPNHQSHKILPIEQFSMKIRNELKDCVESLKDRGFIEENIKVLNDEKSRSKKEIEEIEARTSFLKEKIDMIDGQLKEAEDAESKARLGESVLIRSIEDVSDFSLIDKEKVEMMKKEIKEIVEVSKPERKKVELPKDDYVDLIKNLEDAMKENANFRRRLEAGSSSDEDEDEAGSDESSEETSGDEDSDESDSSSD